MTVDSLATVLEQELEGAVDVKDKKSLHRYILLLTENLVKEDRFERDIGEIKSDVRVIAESMRQGFANMDRRFEDMNGRFDDVNKRFDDVNNRFEDVNSRFEDVNSRFEDVNKRFDDVNKRFDENGKRTTTMFTYLNIVLGILVLITVLFKFV